MSVGALPPKFACRPARSTDAEAILEFVAAYNKAIVGIADCTLDDVRDELTEPGFDRDRDSWLVFDAGGCLSGYGWTFWPGAGDRIDLEVIAREPAVTDWLFRRSLARAREMGRLREHSRVIVDKGLYRRDDAMRRHAEAHGFRPATTFQRLRIDHRGPVALPEPPPGVVVRDGARDETTRRAAHEVLSTALRDHFGFVRRSYPEWLAQCEAISTLDWSQLALAELGGKPVAACLRTGQFLEDEKCGYVWQLGVLPEARGRGIARHLLGRAFAMDAAEGRMGTILHVDSNNTTPALGLYLSVGMRPVLVVDIWRRTLAVESGR